MKYFGFLFLLLPLLFSCNNGTSTNDDYNVCHLDTLHFPQPDYTIESGKFMKEIMDKYADLDNNPIVKDNALQYIDKYFKSFVGQDFTFIDEMPLCLDEVKKISGNQAEVLSVGILCKNEHTTDCFMLYLTVVFKIPQADIEKLKEADYFNISGVLKRWDKTGKPYPFEFNSGSICLGTFEMDKVVIKKTISDVLL